ncbi:MAG: FAD-dependent oxidoreductase [Solirubrobacteraceae bacterium]|nr:FAD-dependent oxidoreductase [Patulibacter sp.]
MLSDASSEAPRPGSGDDGPSVAVIGAGIVGLSVAYALIERGVVPTVFERGTPGDAQSGGESRLFRHAHDDPRLVRLAVEARDVWREWEDRFGRQLVSDDGVIGLGEPALRRLEVLRSFDEIPASEIGSDELAERLPVLTWYDGAAVFDGAGGAIRTRAAIDALTEAVRAASSPGDARPTGSGAPTRGGIVFDEVLSVRHLPDGRNEVRTGSRAQNFDRVIVCAGQGNGFLTRGFDLAIPVTTGAHVRLTYDVVDAAPVFAACLQDGSGIWGETGVYGAPHPGNAHYSVGLSDAVDVRPDGGIVDPTGLADLVDRTNAYVERALPGLHPEPVGIRHCWTTQLPWSDDGFAIWEAPGAFFVAGHNLFKHAPVLGRRLAAATLGAPLDATLHPDARLGAADTTARRSTHA